MKKLVSLICSIALLLTVCIPVYAEDGITPSEFSGSISVGNYTYSLSSNERGEVAAYLMELTAHSIDIQNIQSAISTVKTDIQTAHSANPSYGPDQLWATISNAHNFETIKSQLGITNVSFRNPKLVITDRFDINPTFTLSSSYHSNSEPHHDHDNDHNNSSTSTRTPSTPSNTQTTTNTGTNGETTVNVTAAPDSTPSVSGGTSSFRVTVPFSAVTTAASTATPEKHSAVTISAPTDTMVSQLNNSAVQNVSMSLNVPSEIAYATAANIDVAMNIDSSVLQAAKQTAKDVTVGIVDQLTGEEAYSWTFKGADLANAGTIGNINMSLNVKTSTLDSAISGKVPASDKGVVLTFANNGTLPAPATVKVLVSGQGYQPGETIHMYYYNSETNQVEALDNSAYIVDSDGYVSVVITHCSKYILSSGELAAVNPIRLDTGKELSVQAGKTYQFKVTAQSKPTFTSGNGSIFAVTANGSNGNDYFFKVTAVGKVGQSVGFYVNEEKTPRTVGTIH